MKDARQHKQYDMNDMAIRMMLCTNVKRERVQRQVDQTQTPRYVSRFKHLALHPRLHHRVGFPIHYLSTEDSHRGNLHREGFVTTLGVPNSSLKQPPHNRGVGPQPIQQPTPLPTRVYNQTPSLTRGSKPITRSPLLKRDTTRIRVYNKWFQKPQTQSLFSFSLFPQKTRS